METRWLHRWWAKVIDVLRHPWRSLVSLLAAVGDLTLWILRFLARVAEWLLRQLLRLLGLSLWRLFKGLVYAALALCVLGTLITLFLISYPSYKVPDFQPVDQHVYLSQGWGWTGGQNEPLRQLFYYTPQGAGLKDIRYSWFVNLEIPWGTTKFADPQRMSAYGFLVDHVPTPRNPDRLPVGFTSHYDLRFGENVLDLTCAACHTGELTVNKNGKRYGLRVDGAGAMHAFTAMHNGDFAPELMGSLMATYLNPFKFLRFARPVLGPVYPHGRWKLHRDLGTVIGELLHQAWNDKSRHLYPTEEGPGRVDALGRIGNTVFGDELSPVNYKVANAPVRYPPLWDIWKFDYVQYNASVRQPMTRNVSESLGTGAVATLLNRYGAPIPTKDQFDSSVTINNLDHLEMALWSLEPPKWSEDCLGKIDWDRARRGRVLFQETCQHCHGPFPASEPIKDWFAYLKTSNNKCRILDSWQKFMNDIYATITKDQNQASEYRAASYAASASKETSQPPNPCSTAAKGNAPQVGYSDLPLWIMHSLTVEDIGTDPTAAVNFIEKKIDLRKLGLTPAQVGEEIRGVLEQDLDDKTNAYAKEILRLSGKDVKSLEKTPLQALRNEELRSAALEIASRAKTAPMARNSLDEATLKSDIAQLQDAISVGPSRIHTVLDSLDLSQLNTGVALSVIVSRARARFYEQRRYTEAEQDELNGFGQLDVPVALAQYKPRPLAGIWAAGPFLHNGSVPSIYQLLLPADQRDKKFFVGTRNFDPANLGLATEAPAKNGFWLDTSIKGNSNLGHEFRKGYVDWKPGSSPQYGVIGPEWSEEDRRDILEYLKIHRDEHKLDFAKDPDAYLREGLDTTNVCQ